MDLTSVVERLRYESGLWLAEVTTKLGIVEVFVDGSPEEPNRAQVEALRRFLLSSEESMTRLRRRLRFSVLYRPIRIAVTMENRVGIQFQNKITGAREHILAEEGELAATPW
jgi:hypothetical protein